LKKWEYITVNAKLLDWTDEEFFSTSEVMNHLGDKGWELVSSDETYMYFKREKVKEEGFISKEEAYTNPAEEVDPEEVFTKKEEVYNIPEIDPKKQ